MQTTKATKAARKLAETVAPVEIGAAAPVTAKPETEKAEAPIARRLARDAATVTAGRTNFGEYSNRDDGYLRLIAEASTAFLAPVTLRQIHDAGTDRDGKRVNPYYAGPSAKATDGGALNRLIAAGYFTKSADGTTLTPVATSNVKTRDAYLAGFKSRNIATA